MGTSDLTFRDNKFQQPKFDNMSVSVKYTNCADTSTGKLVLNISLFLVLHFD